MTQLRNNSFAQKHLSRRQNRPAMPFELLDAGTDAFSPLQAQRSARFPRFIGLADRRLRRLDTLHAVVVGCGAVGRGLAVTIARLQPGQVSLVDPGTYSEANLWTQPITAADLGQGKARSTGALLKQINPAMPVAVYAGPVQTLPEDAFADFDVVFLATDNLSAERDVSRRCVRFRRPLIQAAVLGELLIAQVRFLRNRRGRACLVCGWGAQEFEAMSREQRFSCSARLSEDRGGHVRDGSARDYGMTPVEQTPTMSVAGLCSLAADLASMVLLRFALRLGRPLEDCLVEYCGFANATTTSRLGRNEDCPADHDPWIVRDISEAPLAVGSLRDLAQHARVDLDAVAGAASFCIDDHAFIESARCDCAQRRPVMRFLHCGSELPPCQACGRAPQSIAFDHHEYVPLRSVLSVIDRPLRMLGVGRARSAVVRSPQRTVLLRTSGGERSLR